MDDDFSDYDLPTDGAYVSSDGKYTCEDCEQTLDPTYETTVVNGLKRSLFKCPSCGETYPC